ncbi:MAG: AIR synthase family protein [Methanobacteriota archaeon]|nr:MAG: AIR synthase family protein [Euryarchaeota archaeon]
MSIVPSNGPMPLKTGKLPPRLLARSLRHLGARDGRVVVGPKLGEDASVVRLGGQLIVLKTDPVTYASDLIGWYAVHVNANDVATRGATPAWFQAVVLLPEGSDEALPEKISRQISSACEDIGVAVTGGHTEVTPGIPSPIVVGDMHGVLGRRRPVLTSGARVGDAIVLTKAAGIEGTATLARTKRQELVGPLGKRLVDRASKFLFNPGLSVIPEAKEALSFSVRAMHDPTEGGVLMGVYELASASGRSVELRADDVPVLDETRIICDFYDIDPLGLLGSGALLATFRPPDADRYLDALADGGVEATVIGSVVSGKNRSSIVRDGTVRRLSSCERDELLKTS